MIIHAYKTLDEVNTTEGVYTIFQYVSNEVPIFSPMILFAFFIIACLGSYYASIRNSGRGNLSASFAVAGFLTSILATLFSFLNMVNSTTVVLTYVVSILGVLWLFFSGDN